MSAAVACLPGPAGGRGMSGGWLLGAGDDDVVVAAARAGDESAFAALVERHRAELRVHCPSAAWTGRRRRCPPTRSGRCCGATWTRSNVPTSPRSRPCWPRTSARRCRRGRCGSRGARPWWRRWRRAGTPACRAMWAGSGWYPPGPTGSRRWRPTSGPRRARLPRLRDLRGADRGRPHGGAHRLPRPRPVPGVRPADDVATGAPMSSSATRRLNKGKPSRTTQGRR